MEKLGTVYGGWYVPLGMKLNENSIVYSAGVGEDISFDIILNSKYSCNIFLIDPTIKAITHYTEAKKYYMDGTPFSGNIQADYYRKIQSETPDFNKFTFIDKGLWNCADELKFYKQTNEKYVSQSLIENMFSSIYDVVQVDTVKNIMSKNNHTKIDLFKLDIEGAEIQVLEKMLDDKIYPEYLLVEFDLFLKKKDPLALTTRLIDRLLKEGYKILINDAFNITFIRSPVRR